MILLWGPPADPPLTAVLTELLRRRTPVGVIDTASTTPYALRMELDGELRGSLTLGDRQVALEDVGGLYLRPVAPERRPEAVELHEALWAFSEVTEATVLNRPEAMAGNGCKPWQAAQARAAGFRTPATLLTTCGEAARAFAEEHGEVIYKSVSGVRSIVATFDPADGDRLDDLASCPTQFQQRVPGVDVRVHVVGARQFACEVRSGAVDYRYAGREGHDAELTALTLPDEVARRCARLAELAELPLAGIDLRRTPDGEWFCFEINPSPGFTFYSAAAEQPVASAIADLLLAGEPRARRGPPT